MLTKIIKIHMSNGLHARPAAEFVRVASKFKSNVIIEHEGLTINGKSIMGLLMLGLAPGSEIRLIIDGEDEAAALEEITKLLESGQA
ncbi:MAG: HPr family phosphocarrier protein [Leptonema sp. (in: bacteria)]